MNIQPYTPRPVVTTTDKIPKYAVVGLGTFVVVANFLRNLDPDFVRIFIIAALVVAACVLSGMVALDLHKKQERRERFREMQRSVVRDLPHVAARVTSVLKEPMVPLVKMAKEGKLDKEEEPAKPAEEQLPTKLGSWKILQEEAAVAPAEAPATDAEAPIPEKEE